jgi:uncharacterized membrane protein YbhN (UPF0104 family)
VASFIHAASAALARASLPLVGTALGLHVAGLIMIGERWRAILARMGTSIALTRAVLVNLAGVFVRNIMPTTGIGGDAARIALFRSAGAPFADATVTLVYGRLAEVPAIVALVLLGLPAIGSAASRSRAAIVALAAGAAALLVVVAIRSRHSLLVHWRTRLRLTAVPFSLLAVGTAWATASWIETAVRLMIVSAALGVRLSIAQGAALTVFSIVGGFVPTIGSLGAIEGSLMAGLLLFGTPAATAAAITVVERLITYAFSTALGGVALVALGGKAVVSRRSSVVGRSVVGQ